MYPKSIVFDLDGTLIDSVPAIQAALNKIFHEDGIDLLTVEETKNVVGLGAKWMVDKVYKDRGAEIDPADLGAYMDRYIQAYFEMSGSHTVVYEDVVRVLDELHRNDVSMGVCTNKPGATTRPVLKELGLLDFFDAIVTEDDVVHRKPDGRHVLATLEGMKQTPDGAVFVGDSETDMAAAADAGLPAVFVSYGYCHVPVGELQTAAIIDHFSRLPEVLEELVGGA
jgi:phosphoglycolate phosphatase